MTITRSAFGAGLVVSLVLSCAAAIAAEVDGGRIIAADKEPQNWLSHGRTYGEQRFSPLAKITTANVGQLGLAWSHDIASRTARGVEATPIVVDGVMYTTGAWSHVPGATCSPSTPGPASSCGSSIRKSPERTAPRDAATWSTAASPSGRARSTSAPSTAG